LNLHSSEGTIQISSSKDNQKSFTFELEDSLIENCKTQSNGGGVSLKNIEKATIQSTTFKGNSAIHGAGIYQNCDQECELTVTDNTF